MILQILVPQYEETDDIIKNLLNSITLQQNIDFNDIGVIICNDGSDIILNEELFKQYPFNIEYHKEPHRGRSGTRNACIDYAVAAYVMFCDADDMFLNNCALSLIINKIYEGFDILYSYFLNEIKHKTKTEYMEYKMFNHFIHGKVYSRTFLKENHIRWNDNLIYHEDYYFNSLCFALSGNTQVCPYTLYLWKKSETSVSRTPFFPQRTYPYLLQMYDAIIEELSKRDLSTAAKKILLIAIIDGYIILSSKNFLPEFHEKGLIAFKSFYDKYKSKWNIIPTIDKIRVMYEQHKRLSNEIIIDIETWLKQL